MIQSSTNVSILLSPRSKTAGKWKGGEASYFENEAAIVQAITRVYLSYECVLFVHSAYSISMSQAQTRELGRREKSGTHTTF